MAISMIDLPKQRVAAFIVALFTLGVSPGLISHSVAAPQADDSTSEPPSDLRAAHAALRNWLTKTSQGRGWLVHLEADELDRQIALGRKADRLVLQRILSRYEADDAGLERAEFRSVHRHLKNWVVELSIPTAAELPAALRAARQSFRRPTTGEVDAARQELQQALAALGEFLGDDETGRGWKRYLRWGDLQASVTGRGDANVRTLKEILALFSADHEGLAGPKFLAARRALEAYTRVIILTSDPDAPKDFVRRVESLAFAVERGSKMTAAQRQQMRQDVRWLREHRQVPELVQAIGRCFPESNEDEKQTVASGPTVRLMSSSKERDLRKLLPPVDDEGIRRVLADPSLILYTEQEMPRAYQVWDGQLQGVHLASYNISANESEPYGNGNHEFPWATPAGTHRTYNTHSFRFLWLPRDRRGKLRPIVWYRKQLAGDASASYVWAYPVGAVVGEVLTLQGPDGYSYTYEMRLRFRKSSGWGVDVFRPFPTAEDLARRIRELRPDAEEKPKLRELLKHLEEPRELPWRKLADQQPGQRVFSQWAGIDALPSVGDDELVAELLTNTTFTSSLDQTWRVGSNGAWTYAPTTKAGFHVVPANYDAGFVEVSSRSCMRCHNTCNQHVNRFNFGRDWYGRIRGSDGIFSFHPFEPGTISGNGFSSSVQMRQELIRSGVLEEYDRRRHDQSTYTALPDLEG